MRSSKSKYYSGLGSKKSLFIFLSPALLAILIFFFIPVVSAFLMSFTDFSIYALADWRYIQFIGLDNYFKLFDDPLFWISLKNTFYFVIVAGPLSIIASLTAAILLSSKFTIFKSFFRLSFFLPVVTTLVAVAIVWRFIYHPNFGLLNYALGYLNISPIDWLGDPNWAMPAIILMAIWKSFGYNMIIFIAGLQNIPEQLYEAAEIEGANSWHIFRHITLPLLTPTTMFVGIITLIGFFQLFAEPYIMTQGGPLNSTLSIVQYMYQEGFRWWNMGYSAAIAFVLFAIIFTGSIIQLKMGKND